MSTNKGVSAVIATILMLTITIALAGMAYMYISGIFATKTGKIVEIDETATFCSGTTITVYVKNTGTIDFGTSNVSIMKQGGTSVSCDSSTTSKTVATGGTPVKCDNTLGSTQGVTTGATTVVVIGGTRDGPTNTAKGVFYCA